MRNVLTIRLFAMLIPALALGADSPPIRIAVTPGEGDRAPNMRVVDLLVAELTRQPNVIVLEREEVRRILAEQKLNAAGLMAPATAVKAGRLLAADLFVVVDKAPGDGPSQLWMRFLETRTGIVLGDIEQGEQEFSDDPAASAAGVSRVLRKHRTDDKDRRYVGIAEFRSEEHGHELDALTDGLAAVVSRRLTLSPSVIMLDREHLDRLTQQSELTAVELALKTAMTLVEGGVRRVSGDGPCRVNLAFRSFSGRALAPAAVEGPADNVARLGEMVAQQMLSSLTAVPPDEAPQDPKKEAALFASHAGLRSRYGLPAFRHAAAAYALDPTQANLALLAGVSTGVRSKELFLQYWRNELDNLKRKGVKFSVPNIFTFHSPAATGALSDEVRLEQETLPLKFAYYAAAGSDGRE